MDAWAPEALAVETVESCTVSVADADQGVYTHEPDAQGLVPNCDALISLGLTRAHDLDDVPVRDALHALARRVEVWRVDTRPADRVAAIMARRRVRARDQDGVVHAARRRRSRTSSSPATGPSNHTPLAVRHHVGLWNYTQNVVRRAYTPGGNPIDGIAELHFRDPRRLRATGSSTPTRAAPRSSPTSRRFMARPRPETAVMRELPLKT